MTPAQVQAWVGATGGRRFLLTVGCGLANTVLLWFGKLDAGTYATVTTVTVGAYIAAGTWQKGKGVPDVVPTIQPPTDVP